MRINKKKGRAGKDNQEGRQVRWAGRPQRSDKDTVRRINTREG